MKLKNNRETWMDSASVAKSVSKKTSKRNFRGQVVKHTLHLPVFHYEFSNYIKSTFSSTKVRVVDFRNRAGTSTASI